MIYAESEDRQFSGAIVCRSDQSEIELPLEKTGGIEGTHLDEVGLPLVDCKVRANASILNNANKKGTQAEFQPDETILVDRAHYR